MQEYTEAGGNDLYVQSIIDDDGVKAVLSIEDVFDFGSNMKIKLTKKQTIELANNLLNISRINKPMESK